MRPAPHAPQHPIPALLDLLAKLPPHIIPHHGLDLQQQILERLDVFARAVREAVPFAEDAAAVGFVVGGRDDEGRDAVGVAVEGDDADLGGGVFAGGEVGCVF